MAQTVAETLVGVLERIGVKPLADLGGQGTSGLRLSIRVTGLSVVSLIGPTA
jgi:hypothetical protein